MRTIAAVVVGRVPRGRITRIALAVVLLAGAWLAWWRLPAARVLRARALVAATPAWIGQVTLSGPGFAMPLTVRWQRPGWWRVESPGGESAYDGRVVTVRLPGSVPAVAGTGGSGTWRGLWPAPALRGRGPVELDGRGWPVGWRVGGLQVRYTRVTPVPLLPRADFRLTGATGTAAARLSPAPLGFAPRVVPGLRPAWSAAYNLPGQGPTAVFGYTLGAGPLTLAEQPGACPSAEPTWVRTQAGWIVHWCAGALRFTADGPDDRSAIAAIVRGLS